MSTVEVVTALELKFKINENDHNPPHVHVEGYGASVRINLLTFAVMDRRTGYNAATVARIIAAVIENHKVLMEAWNEAHPKRKG